MFATVPFVQAAGAPWVATFNGKAVGSGQVDSENQFEFDVSDEFSGEVEITVGTDGAPSTTVEVSGEDLDILIPYAPGGGYF